MQNINNQIRSISPMQRREGGQTTTTPMVRASNMRQPTRFDHLDPKSRSVTPRIQPMRPEKDQYLQEAEEEINRWKMKSKATNQSSSNIKPIFVNLKDIQNQEKNNQENRADVSRAKSRRKREERQSNSRHRAATQNYPNYKM